MSKPTATNTDRPICSCGCVETHVVWKRTTADNKIVMGWSDGLITFALGFGIKGVSARRSAVECRKDLAASWAVADVVSLHDAAEMSSVIALARKAIRRRAAKPATARGKIHLPAMPGAWEVIATDKSGKPTARAWRFPRLSRFSDLAIWHERGRFSVMARQTVSPNGMLPLDRNTFEGTGFVRTSLRDAFAACRTIMGVA